MFLSSFYTISKRSQLTPYVRHGYLLIEGLFSILLLTTFALSIAYYMSAIYTWQQEASMRLKALRTARAYLDKAINSGQLPAHMASVDGITITSTILPSDNRFFTPIALKISWGGKPKKECTLHAGIITYEKQP